MARSGQQRRDGIPLYTSLAIGQQGDDVPGRDLWCHVHSAGANMRGCCIAVLIVVSAAPRGLLHDVQYSRQVPIARSPHVSTSRPTVALTKGQM